MGVFSRLKGRRGEQQLVLYLKNKGFYAERILNQAHTAGLPDVKAVKGDKTYTLELKTYRSAFKSIYNYYYDNRIEIEDYVVGLALEEGYVSLSTNLISLIDSKDIIFNFPNLDKKEKRLFDRISRLKSKKGTADFLVLKDNGKPRLFLRYTS